MLYNPAKCINGNSTDCDAYYMSNVMLGEKITFDALFLVLIVIPLLREATGLEV